MTTIAIQDLQPGGHDLFVDDESYLAELSSEEELSISGGGPLISWVLTVSSGVCASVVAVSAVVTLTVAVTVELT
jgi:hypothetical protein